LVLESVVFIQLKPESLETYTPAAAGIALPPSVPVAAMTEPSVLESMELHVTALTVGFVNPRSVNKHPREETRRQSSPLSPVMLVSRTNLTAFDASIMGDTKVKVNE
jgi:hypothetical protein